MDYIDFDQLVKNILIDLDQLIIIMDVYHIDLYQPHIDIDQLQSRRERGRSFSWKFLEIGWVRMDIIQYFKNLLNQQKNIISSLLCMYISYN